MSADIQAQVLAISQPYYACVYSIAFNCKVKYALHGLSLHIQWLVLDMFNVHGLAIQWLVMWQSWICSMAYPVVGDMAKLDMYNVHGLAIQWLVM